MERVQLQFHSTLAEWRAYKMASSTIPAGSGGGLIPKYTKFTSSGTFNLPDGYGAAKPLVITIQVIGGGGGGSGSFVAAGANSAIGVQLRRTDYFGDTHATFPVNVSTSYPLGGTATDMSVNANGWGGGSGGIAQTQMSLTGPLTITVGAAGTRSTANNVGTVTNLRFTSWGRGGSSNTGVQNFNTEVVGTGGSYATNAGGTGGTSTAGAVSATGGVGGAAGNFALASNFTVYFPSDTNINSGNNVGPFNVNPLTAPSVNVSAGHGTAGQPAGSAGGATPLLGALAGGSGTTTPVYGAFGVGGKRGDLATHTGVEGTGGGYGSVGASGAVIITYWA